MPPAPRPRPAARASRSTRSEGDALRLSRRAPEPGSPLRPSGLASPSAVPHRHRTPAEQPSRKAPTPSAIPRGAPPRDRSRSCGRPMKKTPSQRHRNHQGRQPAVSSHAVPRPFHSHEPQILHRATPATVRPRAATSTRTTRYGTRLRPSRPAPLRDTCQSAGELSRPLRLSVKSTRDVSTLCTLLAHAALLTNSSRASLLGRVTSTRNWTSPASRLA
jgi:hypothetical protein